MPERSNGPGLGEGVREAKIADNITNELRRNQGLSATKVRILFPALIYFKLEKDGLNILRILF